MAKISANQAELALYAVGKLSTPLRLDVLKDGVLAKTYGLELNRALKLAAELSFDRNQLFMAFRQCADGRKPTKLKTKSGKPFEGKIGIDAEGIGFVEHEKFRWLFEGAALMASSSKRRSDALTQQLTKRTLLSSRAAALKKLVAKPGFGPEDFLQATMALEAAPEAWGCPND